jgi:flavin-dependent dehydrogenase
LTGDAYGFIDPIYSSGVYFAMKSGELAADAIVEGFSKDDLSASQLGNWSAEFDAGTNWIRKLVDKYYTNEFSFGKFMKEFPQHQGNLTDLLIGRIFSEGAGNIFNDMDPAMAKALDEANID